MSKKNFRKVVLNVYLLAPQQTTGVHNFLGLAPYHSGVVFRNQEWTFSQDGVFSHPPKQIDHQFYQAIDMGETDITDFQEVGEVFNELRKEFKGPDYHPAKKNCNHFSDALCNKLLGKGVPSWVNRVANIGGFFSKFVPKSTEKKIMETMEEQSVGRELSKIKPVEVESQQLVNLNHLISRTSIECLNENEDHPVGDLMVHKYNPKEADTIRKLSEKKKMKQMKKITNTRYLESDDDDGMLLQLVFTKKVTFIGLEFKCFDSRKCPKKMRVFKNMNNMDFDDAMDGKYKPVLTITPDSRQAQMPEGIFVPLKPAKFRNTKTLNIFFDGGTKKGENCRVDRLFFFGRQRIDNTDNEAFQKSIRESEGKRGGG